MKAKLLLPIVPFLLSHSLLTAAESPFHLLKELSIAAPNPRTVLSIDDATRRLYAASISDFVVVDLSKDEVIRQATNLASVSCFAVAPRHKLAFYGGDKPFVNAINVNNFRDASGVKTSARPKALLIDPEGSLGVAFCSDQTATTFEPDDGDFMSSFPLPGQVHSAVMDPKARRVFCSIENGNQIAAFKAASKAGPITTWSVAPGENPSALVFDSLNQHLIVGCGNNLLVVMDSVSGKVTDSLTLDSGADTIVFDPTSRQLFATSGKGTVSIVQLLPQKIFIASTLNVPPGSRCLAVDPTTHKLYVGAGDGSKILIFGR